MFKMMKGAVFLLLAAEALLLSACGSVSQIKNGQTSHPVWPEVKDAHPLIKDTQYPKLEALRQLVPGISKLEVYRLIGHPQYNEGLTNVHEWDYVFQLPSGDAGKFTTCQYKQLFDDNMRAAQSFWKPEECAQLLAEATHDAPPPKPSTGEAHVAAQIDISADFLFDFDSAKLSSGAPAAIDSQVMTALNKATQVEVLKIIDYTDRLGTAAYNLKLSQQRALAVKNYLVSQGVPAEAIMTEGRGSTEPKVNCTMRDHAALIACLKPNRRVTVQVIAH